MTLLNQEIQESAMWEGTIGEMGPSIAPELPVPENFMATVRSVDEDPMFVTVEVESGISKSKRKWKPEHLQAVIDKVNNDRMAGNLGHPLMDEKEHERGFPIPQVAWVSAKGRMVGNEMRATFKGYVLKTAQARELLKLGLIDGVSIFGDSRMKPMLSGGYEVISFSPETIDFARKGRAGMKSRVVSLTGEQDTSKGGNSVEPKDIAALSPDEIKTHAPLVYDKIQSDARADLEVKVGEMTAEVGVLKPQIDVLDRIKELLKLEEGADAVEKITNLIKRIEDTGKADIKAFIDGLISKKVKTERGQSLLRRFIGEMESNYDGKLDDELKTKIETDFEKIVKDDEDIQAVVGEMFSTSDDKKNGGNNEGGTGLGGRSRAGNEHGRNENGENKRGGLTIKTRKYAEL